MQTLDINRLDKKWEKINLPSDSFKQRQGDSACYMRENKKIIVFESYNGSKTV